MAVLPRMAPLPALLLLEIGAIAFPANLGNEKHVVLLGEASRVRTRRFCWGPRKLLWLVRRLQVEVRVTTIAAKGRRFSLSQWRCI